MTDTPPPDPTGEEQGASGQFRRGRSGNPTGRPKGARNRVTIALEELLEGEAERITRHAIEMAMEGDAVAMRLVLERVLPVRRGRPVRFDYKPLEKAADVSVMLGAILKAVANGDLTPDEAATIATIAEAKRKAIETMDIERRLDELEAHQQAQQ